MVSGIQKLITEAPLLVISLVFCAGALASISSCTIVRVPVALGFIAGAAESRKNAFFVTVLFVSGLVAAYAAFGLFLGFVGNLAFIIIQFNKYIFYSLGFILFISGLFIAGLLKIKQLPRLFEFRENFRDVTKLGPFTFGTFFALVEMPTCPCCGGILLMLATLVVTHNLAPYAIIIFMSFALGQSFPVIIVAITARLIKTDIIMLVESRIRRVEDHINLVAGNMLITLGIYYFIVA